MTGTEGTELLAEQGFITNLYRRLDRMREETVRLRDTYLRDSDGTPGGRVQRDIAYAGHAQTLVDLNVAEDKLCFGRLDSVDGQSMHIGRMGIFSEGEDREQLLMDWRAPSARPFYVATAAAPLGVRRRRHLRIRRRIVESISDEYLDLTGLSPDDPALAAVSASGLTGEAALLAALNAPRTGRMGDIVETIQAEQDRIIRADRAGILVVQGGPGTGKTAVALHRTAYLLYTHRGQLANRGVLVIGPNRTFLTYIGQVLPSLGENAVVLSTVGDLFPGVRAERVESSRVAVLKGRLNMAKVIANAVLDRQRVPKTTITVKYAGGDLRLDRQLLSRAQERAWQSRRPHNRARQVFLKSVFDQLARQVARRHREGLAAAIPLTSDDFEDIRRDLRSDEDLQAALSTIWPALTAQTLVRDLFASPARLRLAAPFLSDAERDLLLAAAPTQTFSQSDVPLLDEAAELLGQDDRLVMAAATRDREQREEYAQSVLDMLGEGGEASDEGTGADGFLGMVSAADLVELQEDAVSLTSTAERAGADREWTYGHVVVDEAQELSPMAWRVVMRRCPVKSMTLVGDLAQTGDAAGASSWGSVLRPYVGRDWRFEELTVNYRTPAEITAVADRILASIDPKLTAPTSVRSTGVLPWWQHTSSETLVEQTALRAAQDLALGGEQHLAVLVPDALYEQVTTRVAELVPAAGPGHDVARPVVVMTVREAKGLEFDSVILVEPDLIVEQSPKGRNDLYVAVTRATQRLGVLYTGRRPAYADPAPEASAGLW
ncbi:DNA helicase IV [Nakamurella panacisegetis]|uniref:DNA helicase IV n=1 Tax=Nakamurella panacisegetis TaxID=1090615 RepID=A0A1H0RYX4_9ACTN|nr:ATP-binding domain-containing protein [Nakamurella panacisegetis]SDP34772.1 DNA helicase IV [Nakamurella panacisegetis]